MMSSLRRTVFTILAAACALPMVAQSVYTLETLPADQFEPSIGFESIVGLHMDPQGNITGLATKGTQRQLGFYWPSNGNPVRKLVFSTPSSATDCEPKGIDAEGLVHIYCNGISLNAVYEPTSGNYRELKAPEDRTFEVQGAGGELWSVGSSSRSGQGMGVPPNACSAATSEPTRTFGFVSTLRSGGDRVTALLPLVPGDTTATSMTPSAINIHAGIVGTREGCGDVGVPSGRRAVLWKSRGGAWSANFLDRYPISLDTGICARDLVLTEARAINDSGQITGAGYCIDSEGSRRSIAYRLTPTGVEAP